MRRLVAIPLAVGVLAAACSAHPGGGSARAPEDAAARPARVPGEYLVTLAPGADATAIREVYGRFGITRVQDLGRSVFLVSLADDPGPVRMDELRKADARIRAVQPNFTYRG